MQPYLLNDAPAYQAWREQKLNNFPDRVNELIIELNNSQMPISVQMKIVFQP